MLSLRSAAGFHARLDLFVRVHLLQRLRHRTVARRVPELRRRAGATPNPFARSLAAIPRHPAAHLQTQGLRVLICASMAARLSEKGRAVRAEALAQAPRLSDFLRLTLQTVERPQITLAEEIKFVGHYLDIQQIRVAPHAPRGCFAPGLERG